MLTTKLNGSLSHLISCGWRTLTLTAALLISCQAYATQSITFYHNDLLGSPVAATDENGDLCWREDYQPYGDKLENEDAYEPATTGCGLDDNQIGYTGHVIDKDLGLTYMQARYYDPIVGRFMGVDPVGIQLDNQVSFNRYAYANNNPYKFVDPDGRYAFEGNPHTDRGNSGMLSALAEESAGMTTSERISTGIMNGVLGIDHFLSIANPVKGLLTRGIKYFGQKVTKKIGKELAPYYPPNRGFLGQSEKTLLQPGTKVDRFGFDGGSFVAPQGTPAPMRALPPGSKQVNNC